MSSSHEGRADHFPYPTPAQLAALFDEWAQGPVNGGKMAQIAYVKCAQLVRSKLVPAYDLQQALFLEARQTQIEATARADAAVVENNRLRKALEEIACNEREVPDEADDRVSTVAVAMDAEELAEIARAALSDRQP